ncbi:MAG: histidinol-phosphate transaminase [Clostridia bacterium]|nr:histidinol-phosphate transaminase [Clostridia bacterium]
MSYESALAARLVPYVPGEQPKGRKLIKLNTNEHPYGPSPRVKQAMDEAMARLRLYPDAEATALREAIAQVNGLRPEQVFCGNGSDEVLAFAFAAFFSGKKLYAPSITYSFYPVYADLFGVMYEPVPLHDDFTVDVESLCQGGPVVLANPNAPTSLFLDMQAIEKLAAYTKEKGEVLLVDEAYAAFAPDNARRLLDRYENLLIVRTFSKSHGLAGLRVGYAMGSPELIASLRKVRDSFNSYPLDCLAQAGAREAMLDVAWTEETVGKICQTRDRCIARLRQKNVPVFDSATNFLFVKADAADAKHVQEALRERGILVRYFSGNVLCRYLRISVGTDEEMDRMTDALLDILGKT